MLNDLIFRILFWLTKPFTWNVNGNYPLSCRGIKSLLIIILYKQFWHEFQIEKY